MNSKRDEVRQEVQKWLRNDPIYLDTETTGLGSDAEIIQIGIVDSNGAVLSDYLVKPIRPIPLDAAAIHGISNAMVADAHDWLTVWDKVLDVISGKSVVIYNAAYDIRMLIQTFKAHGVPFNPRLVFEWTCAMEAYAEFYGEWNDYRQSYKWQRLEVACQQQGIITFDITAHRATGDCEMTRRLCQTMARDEVTA